MISVRNFGRKQFKSREEEIEAQEAAQGTIDVTYKQPFRIIHVKLRKKGEHFFSGKGWQNTRINVDMEGNYTIEHLEAGRGSLFFDWKDNRDNRFARLALTDHNVKMLISHWRMRQWDIVEKDISDMIEAKQKEWWAAMPEGAKAEIIEREKLSKLLPSQVEKNFGMNKLDITQRDLIKETAKLQEDKRILEEKLNDLSSTRTPETEKIVEKIAEQKKAGITMSDIDKQKQAEMREAVRNMSEEELKAMKFFKLRDVVRKCGIKVEKIAKIDELKGHIKQIRETSDTKSELVPMGDDLAV